jgi:hypothetical protein
MRTVASILFGCIALVCVSSQANAQNAAPPAKPEEGETPAVTIKEPKVEQKITESRDQSGKVTEIKVNKGKNTYYLKPNVAPGSALPGDGQSPQTRPAQWQIYEFNKPKKPKDADSVDVPPPTMAPAPVEKK